MSTVRKECCSSESFGSSPFFLQAWLHPVGFRVQGSGSQLARAAAWQNPCRTYGRLPTKKRVDREAAADKHAWLEHIQLL